MAVDAFIPEVWSRELLVALRKVLVAAQPAIVNRNYEGEITQAGDTVHIRPIGSVTVFNYVKNTNMPPPQELSGAEQLLQITESKGFNFQIDDVDAAQLDVDLMQGAMAEAANSLAEVADSFVINRMVTGTDPGNVIGTAAAPANVDATTLYDQLVDLGVLLSNAKVPRAGRWAMITPKAHGLLQKSDDFTKASDLGDDVTVNGRVGRAAGFDLFETHNMPTLGTGAAGDLARKPLIAGTNAATSYAEQINKTEGYRPEGRFADAVKGLHLYGGKVVRPTALAILLAEAADV